MATLGLGVGGAAAGAAIGFAITGGNPAGALLGAQLGFTAGLIVANILFAEKQVLEGARLEDLKVTTSTYGKVIPLIKGTKRVGGNVFWATDLVEHANTQTSGGKGGGPKVKSTTFTYTASFAVGFSNGPDSCILKIWADGKLIANLSGDAEPLASEVLGINLDPRDLPWLSPNATLGEDDVAKRQITLPGLRLYLGTGDQEPDPAIQDDVGVDNCPAYRGLTYAVFEDMLLTDFGNRIPQITALVVHPSCVEAFPFDTLNSPDGIAFGTGATGPNDMWFSDDFKTGVMVEGDDDRIIHIDLVTHEVIKIVELPVSPYTGAPVGEGDNYVDVDGGWMLTAIDDDDFGMSSTPYMINIHTGQIIAQGGRGSFVNFVGTRKVTWRCGDFVYFWGQVAGGRFNVVNVSILPPLVPTEAEIPGLTIVHQGDTKLSNYPGVVAPGANGVDASFCDNEGFYYMAFWETGTAKEYLNRFENGFFREQITLSLAGDPGSCVFYEPVQNAVVFQTTSDFWEKWSLDTLTQINTMTAPTCATGNAFKLMKTQPFGGQLIYTTNIAGGVGRVDILNMVEIDSGFTMTDWQSGLGVGGGIMYSPIDHSAMFHWSGDGATNYFNYLDRANPGTELLSDVVTDISERVTLTPSDIDVTELTDLVYGWAISSQTAAKNSLVELMRPYFFDAVESDFIVKFPKRGGAPVKSIPEIDLGAAAPGQESVKITETRDQEFENFPAVISMSYSDPDQDDLTNTQVWRRAAEAVNTRQHLNIDLPFVFPNSVARNIVERLGAQLWFQRTKYETSLTWEHIDLDPADVVDITFDGVTIRAIIIDLSLNADGSVAITLVSENINIYTRTATAQDQLGVPQQTITIRTPPLFWVADMQSLTPAGYNELAFYVGATVRASGGTYSSSEIFQSTDLIDWESIALVTTAQQAAGGFTTSALPAPTYGHTVFDRENTLSVRLNSGSLSSSTETTILTDGETNALVVESSLDDSWEIIQFVNATLEADGTYTLDTFLRGRRGSEDYMDGHIVGDRVWIPTTTTTQSIEFADALLGTNLNHTGVAIGDFITSGTISNKNVVGRRLRPWAPSVDEAYTDSNGDVQIRWRRRSRGEVALESQPFERVTRDLSDVEYEVDMINADGTVARTITTTASANGSVITLPSNIWSGNVSAVYDAADATADGFDGSTFICYQINPDFTYNSGRGEPALVTIDART